MACEERMEQPTTSEAEGVSRQVKRAKQRAASYGYRGSHFTASERLALLETCGGACMACGEKDPTVDHIIPLSLGGTNVIENVQPLCSAFNLE